MTAEALGEALSEALSFPGAFPSLDDAQLTELGAPPIVTTPSVNHLPLPSDRLSHEQLEKKYGALTICLRSDRRTTQSRLEQLRRKRDQSETNMMAELAKCREAVSMQAPANAQLQMQLLEAAGRAAGYMVQAAEAYGAVQQEGRIMNALDLLTQYVESLKHVHSKVGEHRSLLTAAGLQPSEPSPRTGRYGSLSSAPTSIAKTAGSKRRASIAALPRAPTFGSPTISPALHNDDSALRFLSTGSRPRRVSLQPRASSAALTSAAVEATAIANDRMVDGGVMAAMAEISELSESRRESVVGKSDDEDGGDLDDSGRRVSRIESDESPADDIDDAASEDDQLGKIPEINFMQQQQFMEQTNQGVMVNSYPFLNNEFWRRGSIAVTRRLSELRRNSYRAVRMSVSCCLLAAAAAVLVSTLLGGGASNTAQRRRQ